MQSKRKVYQNGLQEGDLNVPLCGFGGVKEPCPALAMKSKVSSLLTSFHSSQRCGSVEQSDKVRILSHFAPVMNPLSFST